MIHRRCNRWQKYKRLILYLWIHYYQSVLHDWNDEECIHILRKCKEAIPKENGKVIIIEAVIREDEEEEDKYSDLRLALDMVMLAHTSGKERTGEEWEFVIKAAGFSHFTVKHIEAVVAIIQAYPWLTQFISIYWKLLLCVIMLLISYFTLQLCPCQFRIQFVCTIMSKIFLIWNSIVIFPLWRL